jgi:hypothetical protein
MCRSALVLASGAVILLGAVAMVMAAEPSATAFTYRGELVQGGAPAEGVFDLALELYDLPTDGSLLARAELAGVEVRDGAFTVVVDFGLPLPGCGVNRFLETHVRPAGGSEYTRLLPLQPLKSRADCTVDGTLTVTAMLELPDTAASGGVPTAGVLFLGGEPFLHGYGSFVGNTFLGRGSGNFSMTGGTSNTAVGFESLSSNVTGTGNTAVGYQAHHSNQVGDANVAIGASALAANTAGHWNIAIGAGAGSAITGSYNIDIGNEGVAGDWETIRIGNSDQFLTYIAGIRGSTTGQANAIPVLIDSNGQLGTTSSSIRAKQDVQDMGDASSRVMNLRPVTFHYTTHPDGPLQYGLVAEEVEQVMPELVVRDATGEVESVAYHEMPAMLLNELQKQQAQIEELRRMVQALTDERSAAEARESGKE